MDVILINPGGRKANYQNLDTAVEPPVWCLMIAGYLRGKGVEVDILDANALELSAGMVADEVVERKPKLIAVVVYGHNPTASTQVMPEAGRICSEIKKRSDVKIVMLGGHVAALPWETLKAEEVDVVCGDEGFESLLTILDDPTVQNVISMPLLENLDDEIPCLPWELLPMEKYKTHNWQAFGEYNRQPYASIYTTLGCPYNCNYCPTQAPFKEGEILRGSKLNSYREFSPDWVIKEFDRLYHCEGITNYKIADEMFLFDYVHVEKICDLLIERDYGLNIWAYARANHLPDDRLLLKMKKSGINWLGIGIESGNASVRRQSGKALKEATIEESVDRIHRAGISIVANYMFGLPGDTWKTMGETFDLAIKLNCEYVNFNCCMAYPGSELYKQAIQERWKLPETWEGYSQLSQKFQPLRTEALMSQEIVRFRDNAFIRYFERVSYTSMLTKKFGYKAVEEVDKMLSVKLERG